MLLKRRISILYFINVVKWQILGVVVFAIIVAVVHVHPIFKDVTVPLSVLTVLGTTVTILLAFRTSQSYERWWEARIVWGAIVNDSRTFVREVIQFLAKDPEAAKEFAERQIIWTYALGESLRKLPFTPPVSDYLSAHNISSVNIPNELLNRHSNQVRDLLDAGKLSDFQQLQLNETISDLCDSMGKCERIKTTVFPRSYSILLQTLIYTFTALLPFGLDHSQLYVEIMLSVVIPIIYISIEKTSIMMQDPFENTPVDTPMTSIAQTIEINIRQMLGKEPPVKEDTGLYYEM